MPNFKLPYSNVSLPWFIFDIMNFQLITTPTIPLGDITDSKEIVLSETPIPGLSFNPINSGGMGNRKITFTLPLIKRNNVVGNVLLLKQFDNLRNQAFGLKISNIYSKQSQFTPNPKVLYYWGAGNGVPLEYYVKRCDFNHRSAFVNRYGATQYTEINIELWLDETSPLYYAEELFRKTSSYIAMVESAYNLKRDNQLGSNL